jgi:signal transduction histidine kinase/CheY-like chemotaxis protein
MKVRLSIRTKSVGFLFGAFALILLSFLLFEFHVIHRISRQQAEETGKSLAQLFDNLVFEKPELFNTKSLQPVVHRFDESLPVVARISIIDHSLRIIADSDASRIGEFDNKVDPTPIITNENSHAYPYENENVSYLRVSGPLRGSYDPLRHSRVIGVISVDIPLWIIEAKIKKDFLDVTYILLGLTAAFIICHLIQIQLGLVRPLLALSTVTRRIGTGDLSARIEETRTDEIGDVGRSINQMAMDLEEANRALLLEIEERRLAQNQVEAAKERAELASRAKSDFLANMSHEIRTPLNGVIGMLNLILDSGLDDRQRELAEISRTSADSLLTIINDILDFSKIEAGKLEIEPIPFDLRLLVEEIGGVMALKAEEKSLDLIIRYLPNTPRYVISDPGRIRQCLLNLISNAIKFTSCGHVLVTVQVEEQSLTEATIRFSITDTGIGIGPDQLEHIFGRFTQVDATTTRLYGGTGLGLAITKKLAELLGAKVSVTSTLNAGSTFWFSLPLTVDTNQLKPPLKPKELADVRIMIVGHSDITREVLHEQVISWGMRNGSCSSARDALRTLRAEHAAGDPYEIVLIDYQMPQMDGLELGCTIKADPNLKDLKLVLISSIRRQGDTDRASEAGFAAYLTKPVRQSQLMDTLVSIWRNEGRFKENTIITESALRGAHRAVEDGQKSFNARVLVVDDNPVNQRVAELALEGLGCRVDLAGDGKEAVEMVGAFPYELILMDCEMPVMDGFAATAEIRQKQDTKRTPIVAMTARALEGDRQKCIRAGMDDYVTKPIRLEDFSRILSRWAKDTVRQDASRLWKASTGDSLGSANSKVLLAPEQLARLRELIPNEETLKELFNTFINETSEVIEELRIAAQERQCDELKRLSHKLSGAALNLGATQMANICDRLNDLSQQATSSKTQPLIDKLEHEFKLIKDFMSHFEELVKT